MDVREEHMILILIAILKHKALVSLIICATYPQQAVDKSKANLGMYLSAHIILPEEWMDIMTLATNGWKGWGRRMSRNPIWSCNHPIEQFHYSAYPTLRPTPLLTFQLHGLCSFSPIFFSFFLQNWSRTPQGRHWLNQKQAILTFSIAFLICDMVLELVDRIFFYIHQSSDLVLLAASICLSIWS